MYAEVEKHKLLNIKELIFKLGSAGYPVSKSTSSFIQNSMYRGEMEPSLCKGVYPGGGCADWAVYINRGVYFLDQIWTTARQLTTIQD